jgi:DNA-binding NarL/FixJ family response regulator
MSDQPAPPPCTVLLHTGSPESQAAIAEIACTLADHEEMSFYVKETAPTLATTLELLHELTPDLVILGPMPARAMATSQICGTVCDGEGQPTRVLVIAPQGEDQETATAVRAGAVGFLRASARREVVVMAVEAAVEGHAPRSLASRERLVEGFLASTSSPRRDTALLQRLTRREREVFYLVAAGLSNTEIAGELVVATSTIKTHVNAILTKLHLRDRVQATVFAYSHGMTQPEGASS